MNSWYGNGANGDVYRYFPDNAGGSHFSGIVPAAKVPNPVLKLLGGIMKTFGDINEFAIEYSLNDKYGDSGTVRFFVWGPIMACHQAGPDVHQVGLMNRSPYRIAN